MVELTSLPAQYQYLLDEPSPRILIQALKEYGTLEAPGTEDNPKIMGWAQEIGRPVSLNYQHDSTPWCGLFMAVCAKRAGLDMPPAPLWALSWSRWGDDFKGPIMLGDVLTFKRAGGGGHVALYVGEDKTHYHILGGNQKDQVCIVRKPKGQEGGLYAARRTRWRTSQPPNIRRVFLANSGIIAGSEA